MVTYMYASLPSLEEIWAWLDSVSDPEIPILSVVDLGIVRNVRWAEEGPDFTTEQTSPRENPTSVIDGRLRRPGAQRTRRSDLTLLVTVTPTYSGCPAMAVIKNDIQRALLQRGISRVCIETQLSPAWTTDWMTERGRKRLHEYGIAPPEHEDCKLGLARVLHSPAQPDDGRSEARSTGIPCPRCGSSDTRLVSRFGSTPCKAFYTCNSCLEPFDYFKCH
jgi:ring-1,2-phenylacetyl-CoA epoxidase subunit PaaD